MTTHTPDLSREPIVNDGEDEMGGARYIRLVIGEGPAIEVHADYANTDGDLTDRCHAIAARLQIAWQATAGLSPAFLARGGIGRMREAIDNLLEVLLQVGWVDASYCELCDRHAPRDPRDGSLLGPIKHKDDCPAGQAIALLSEIPAPADAEQADDFTDSDLLAADPFCPSCGDHVAAAVQCTDPTCPVGDAEKADG